MMEAARSLGLAARFVSGYLYDERLVDAGEGLVGGGATHAWVQIYLPGAGWVEYDPTNALVGGRNLIRVAVTRDPSQAVPLVGSFTGDTDAFVSMSVKVEVRRSRPAATRDAHRQLVRPAAEDHAAQRRDVAEIAAPGDRHVIARRRAVLLVGSSSTQPNGGQYTATQACEAASPPSCACARCAGASRAAESLRM